MLLFCGFDAIGALAPAILGHSITVTALYHPQIFGQSITVSTRNSKVLNTPLKTQGREYEKVLRSLEQFIQTVNERSK